MSLCISYVAIVFENPLVQKCVSISYSNVRIWFDVTVNNNSVIDTLPLNLRTYIYMYTESAMNVVHKLC